MFGLSVLSVCLFVFVCIYGLSVCLFVFVCMYGSSVCLSALLT